MGSVILPRTTMGDDCLLGKAVELVVSVFRFKVIAAPGLDLPADGGLSGKVVRRFGGVSSGKSGGTIGFGWGRTRGPGELGRETEERFCLARVRPPDAEGPVAGNIECDGDGFRRVGVEGLDVDRTPIEFVLAETCGLEIGVEGLEFWDGLGFSVEGMFGAGWTLQGVEDLETFARAEGVEGLVTDEERLVGVEDLIKDDTDAELVLRIGFDLFELIPYWKLETDGRVAELLRVGLAGRLLSD